MRFYFDTEDVYSADVEFIAAEMGDTFDDNNEKAAYAIAMLAAEYISKTTSCEDFMDAKNEFLEMVNTKISTILALYQYDEDDQENLLILSKADLDGMAEAFGDEIRIKLRENRNNVLENIQTLKELYFYDIERLIEESPYSFFYLPEEFNAKVLSVIERLGDDYVEKIKSDISLLENM